MEDGQFRIGFICRRCVHVGSGDFKITNFLLVSAGCEPRKEKVPSVFEELFKETTDGPNQGS